MNGETKLLETPALISAIVKDVQQAKVVPRANADEEPARSRDAAETRPSLEDMIELALGPGAGNVRATLSGNGIKKLDASKRIDGRAVTNNNVQSADKLAADAGVDGGEKLRAVSPHSEERSLERPPGGQVSCGDAPEAKEVTPATEPVSLQSPAAVPDRDKLKLAAETGEGLTEPPQILVTPLVESGPREDSPRKKTDAREDACPSPWSPDLFEDRPVVYTPSPFADLGCDDAELEELANAGRTNPQPLGSNHQLLSVHEHEELAKSLHDLPLDSAEHGVIHSPKRSKGEEVGGAAEKQLEPRAAERPKTLFRVPSVLQQMQDEPPPLPAPHAHDTRAVAEYKLDSAEFASEHKEVSSSSRSHPALQVAESLVMPTTFRDLNFRDSDGHFHAESEAGEGSWHLGGSSEGSKGRALQDSHPVKDGERVVSGAPDKPTAVDVKARAYDEGKQSLVRSADELSESRLLEHGSSRERWKLGEISDVQRDACAKGEEGASPGQETGAVQVRREEKEKEDFGEENGMKIPGIWEVLDGDVELGSRSESSRVESFGAESEGNEEEDQGFDAREGLEAKNREDRQERSNEEPRGSEREDRTDDDQLQDEWGLDEREGAEGLEPRRVTSQSESRERLGTGNDEVRAAEPRQTTSDVGQGKVEPRLTEQPSVQSDPSPLASEEDLGRLKLELDVDGEELGDSGSEGRGRRRRSSDPGDAHLRPKPPPGKSDRSCISAR